MLQDEYLKVGAVVGAHGLHGALKIHLITDMPERFDTGKILYLDHEGALRPLRVTGFVLQTGRPSLLSVEEISDRDEAEALKGSVLCVRRDEALSASDELLQREEYPYCMIIGAAVFLRAGGTRFGTVSTILEAGAGAILVIADSNGREHLVPFVESMVDTSALGENRLVIDPVDGLLDI
jgi:16S rRNA processing protein RimM